MRFFQTLFSGAALISAAAALITIDSFPSSVVAGQTYTISFSPKDSNQYTFILRKGASGNLGTVGTLTTSATSGSFQWTVSKSLADGSDYALQIKQGDDTNYSGQFGLTGGSGTASSAMSSAMSTASAMSSLSMSSVSSRSASMSSSASMSMTMSRSASVSASSSMSASRNATISSATLSRTASMSSSSRPTGASSTTTSGPPQITNGAPSFVATPLAAMLGAFAAFAYLA